MNSSSGGRLKRPREPDVDDETSPAIRIKCERDIKEETPWDDEELMDPPTPPVPRSINGEAGQDTIISDNITDKKVAPLLPTIVTKQEEMDMTRSDERNVQCHEYDRPFGDVKVKTEPVVVENSGSHEDNQAIPSELLPDDYNTPCSSRQALAREKKPQVAQIMKETTDENTRLPVTAVIKTERSNDSYTNANASSSSDVDGAKKINENPIPPVHARRAHRSEENWEDDDNNDLDQSVVIDFFNLPSQPQVPNVMSSEVRHPSTVRPEKAGYYNVAPEQEQQYGTQTMNPIPIYIKKSQSVAGSGSGDESGGSDNEERKPKTKDMQLIMPVKGRYFTKQSVYEKYDFETRKVDATKLAVNEKKEQILNILEKSRVLIIEGFTGCGKTTQVPQYILDECRLKQRFCNIVVTQPRKIAAISVARRVCFERCWNLGTIVGYQVGMESRKDKDETLLTFVTTGVLQQQLISKKSLKDYTHIIIDEVHERDLESDFLLLLIKKIMSLDVEGKEQHVKLILMSATIKTQQFERYFAFKTPEGRIVGPRVVKIPMTCRYSVDEIYLDDILTENGQLDLLNQIETNLDREKAIIQDDIYDQAVAHIIELDKLEKANILDPRIRNREGHLKDRGSVLIFLPGMEEIKKMERVLHRAEAESEHTNLWVIVPLHSSISSEDQSKVFEPAKGGMRKIILSTNIAESSVTVPDIAYVYDFCLTKSLCIDKTTNFTTLRLIWASKSQCVQRRGRAGRVANGKVFRLIPKSFYDALEDEIVPEMKRSNLETIILHCKKFELDSPKNLLSEALDKPDLSGIQRATATLKELGALTIEMEDRDSDRGTRYDDCDGDFTFVGRIMADLPIPQQCTRLILLGHCFGVMQEAIIIAAGVSVKSPFQSGFRKQLDMYLKKLDHASKTFSDLFALYYVYKAWDLKYAEGYRRSIAERTWAQSAQVHVPVLREIKATVSLLEERLKRLGVIETFVLPGNAEDPADLTSEQCFFLKLAIAGAFYPRYFLRRRPDLRQYERDMQREVNGHDVFRTVYFKGFPKANNGKLYAKYVADYLSYGLSVPAVKFDGQKVLAIFDNSTGDTIGPFNRGIFRAIKLRQLRTEPLEFNLLWMDKESAAKAQWDERVRRRECTPCPPLRNLPPIDFHKATVKVQHIVSPSRFWVIIQQDFEKLQELCDVLANDYNCSVLPRSKLSPNSLCLAPYQTNYYRAKILRVEQMGHAAAPKALVYFVDYGNSEWIPSSVLYDFSRDMIAKKIHRIPCMAIECRLKELKPNILYGLHWSRESINLMEKFRNKAHFLEFEIFSIHDSVMIGELVGYNEQYEQRCSLNDLLKVKQGEASYAKIYGEYAPEPYFSMENHRKRERAHLMTLHEKQAAGMEQVGEPLDLDFMDPPKEAKTPCRLKGPWSPLEMSFQALVHCSNTKEVRVENGSVNSVLLDHEPTASNSRMLVAAHVGVVEKSQAVMVRESTVMPSIPGVLSLICLMFAPKAELRVDSDVSKYTGVLCGCGTIPDDPRNSPVHPDNDMEVVFDTEIDAEDIDNINIIRSRISSILRTGRGINKAEVHKSLRSVIRKVFLKKRKPIIEEVWPQEEYVWNRISPDELHEVGLGLSFNHEDIFQPHRRVKLNEVPQEEYEGELPY